MYSFAASEKADDHNRGGGKIADARGKPHAESTPVQHKRVQKIHAYVDDQHDANTCVGAFSVVVERQEYHENAGEYLPDDTGGISEYIW